MASTTLTNFIKYCLGYIQVARQRSFLAQSRIFVELPKELIDLKELLLSDNENGGPARQLVNLSTFYSLDPKKIPKEMLDQYEREKAIAQRLEDIYNQYRNNQFTKQIIFNFGHFEIEMPIAVEENGVVLGSEENKDIQSKVQTKIDKYPLFILPISIEKEEGKYFIYPVDSEIQINIGMLGQILGEDSYYQLVEKLGQYEIDGAFSLPVTNQEIFTKTWHEIKAQLKLKNAIFDENSFALEEIRIALGPRVNYFLAEDLRKLSKLSEEELRGTSLTSWIENDELSIEGEIPLEKELYFPFLYDRFKFQALSVIKNKASVIQGPPGTGKSEFIANLLCHFAATGKRVLFVSQKAQALKVVKDKLKKLGINYLFGYIPNPRSAQLGEEDERDSIAVQLNALNTYVWDLGYKYTPRRKLFEDKMGDDRENSEENLGSVLERKEKVQHLFSDVLKKEKSFYVLHNELLHLKEFELDLNHDHFRRIFSTEWWEDMKSRKANIERLSTAIQNYNQARKKEEFNALFHNLSKNVQYSPLLRKIKEDVEKSGYDGHSKLFRSFNNILRTLRLRKIYNNLPREIQDYFNPLLAKDLSRIQATKAIEGVYFYFCFLEQIEELAGIKKQFTESLHSCGLSNESLSKLEVLIGQDASKKIDSVKRDILRVQEIKEELAKLKTSHNLNELKVSLVKIQETRQERIVRYIKNIINKNIVAQWKEGVTVKQLVNRLAKAFRKSRKAFKTFDALRRDPDYFNGILDLVPVWIMELDDASRIIPLEAGVFDYVILDEASQCNIAYTVPTMFRAKRVILVGDSEQMRDSTILFKSNKSFDELARKYQINDTLQIKATGSAVQSVLDIGEMRGFPSRPLLYHYRSPRELIGFSNTNFYIPNGKKLIVVNSNYLTYKETRRIILIHKVTPNPKEEISDITNFAEAEAILGLFERLRSDEHYRDKSVGVISFFNDQASLIRKTFEDAGYKEENDNYKVSIVDGIQGDEKDIIIYSFVIKTSDQRNHYLPLTGEQGDIRGDINRGRVNVAFSRARMQVHCFVSLAVQDFPDGIWVKKYLKYADECGEVNVDSEDLKPFDVKFEEDFFRFIKRKLGQKYKIQNQVESCGFKIDFVVSNIENGKKIAIECDGPTHFQDEIDEEYGVYVDSDIERQEILENAGWKFYRVKYSDWIDEQLDKNLIARDLHFLLS